MFRPRSVLMNRSSSGVWARPRDDLERVVFKPMGLILLWPLVDHVACKSFGFMSAVVWLQFDDITTPVALDGASGLLAVMPAIVHGWHFRRMPEPPHAAAEPIRISVEQDSFVIRSRWLDKPTRHDELVNVICALIIELVWAYLEDHPEVLCLHGAAAEFAGRLVVFPNKYHAGKSLLTGCLAAAGQRIFTDDILPIEVGRPDAIIKGVALGIAPRLRLPLPDNLSAAERQFLDANSGPASRRYRYLSLDDRRQARRHARLPVGAIVLLSRQDEGEAVLEDVGQGEILRDVVWQNFARRMPSGNILHVLQKLVSGVGLFRLRYSDAAGAVAELQAAFAGWTAPDARLDDEAGAARPDQAVTIDKLLPVPAGHYRQMPGVYEHASGKEHFLADGDGVAIHHLNPTAATIWRLLAEPSTRQDVVDLFHSAFPDQPLHQITEDVSGLIDKLHAKQLLQFAQADADNE